MPRQIELGSAKPRTRVVAGILRNECRQILIADRLRCHSMQEFWEFPGGKIEGRESPGTALRRELEEELGIDALEINHFQHIAHDYPDMRVSIDFFIVTGWKGVPKGIEGQQLRWVHADDLDTALLLPADVPVIEALKTAR